MCPDTSFMSSAYTSFVERLHCQVGSEGWYGVHPPYEDVDLKSMVRSSEAVNSTSNSIQIKNRLGVNCSNNANHKCTEVRSDP